MRCLAFAAAALLCSFPAFAGTVEFAWPEQPDPDPYAVSQQRTYPFATFGFYASSVNLDYSNGNADPTGFGGGISGSAPIVAGLYFNGRAQFNSLVDGRADFHESLGQFSAGLAYAFNILPYFSIAPKVNLEAFRIKDDQNGVSTGATPLGPGLGADLRLGIGDWDFAEKLPPIAVRFGFEFQPLNHGFEGEQQTVGIDLRIGRSTLLVFEAQHESFVAPVEPPGHQRYIDFRAGFVFRV